LALGQVASGEGIGFFWDACVSERSLKSPVDYLGAFADPDRSQRPAFSGRCRRELVNPVVLRKPKEISMSTNRRPARLFACIAILSVYVSHRASAETGDLLNRVPPGANCIVYIDVDSLLNSKLGRQEDWRSKLSDAYATRPLVVPPDAKKVVMASWLEPAYVESLWEVSLIQVGKSISMERIARDTGGFSDAIGGKTAAWAPMNAYFVRLDKSLLGVVCPADRQFAARWIAQANSDTDRLSPYLRAAAEQIDSRTGYLYALDLQDAVSEKRFRRRLDMEEFECLNGKRIDARKLSEAVAGIKGLTLTIGVADEITGRCVIEFARPVSVLSSIAKPLLIEALEKAGASISDFASWKFTLKDTSILASGTLSTEGFRQLLSVMSPPSPTQTDGDTDGSAAKTADRSKPAEAKSNDAQAAASKRYYRAVAKIVDGFGKRVQAASSLSKGATYVARDARSIGRLPILNVDPELVKWGGDVGSRLLLVASSLGTGGLQARSRAENVLNPYSGGGYTSELEIQSDPNDEVNRQNAARLRRAAVAEEKAKALQQATQILLELQTSSAQIRTAMTQKYYIDF
jgi:hypothetical protein